MVQAVLERRRRHGHFRLVNAFVQRDHRAAQFVQNHGQNQRRWRARIVYGHIETGRANGFDIECLQKPLNIAALGNAADFFDLP